MCFSLRPDVGKLLASLTFSISPERPASLVALMPNTCGTAAAGRGQQLASATESRTAFPPATARAELEKSNFEKMEGKKNYNFVVPVIKIQLRNTLLMCVYM